MINNLKNAKITDMRQIHDYLQITTDNGRINIYNPVKYHYADNDCSDLRQSHFSNGPEAFCITLNSGGMIAGA